MAIGVTPDLFSTPKTQEIAVWVQDYLTAASDLFRPVGDHPRLLIARPCSFM